MPQFDEQDPADGTAPSSFTNDTVVVNDPQRDTYCVRVWDRTGQGADFEVRIGTEDGVRIAMPSIITGQLGPGEFRQLACGLITPAARYGITGGGKFLFNAAASTLRVDLNGAAETDNASSFSDSVDIGGRVLAYDYSTRTLIESVAFSSLQGSLQGSGDFAATGSGTALVNGVATNITFNATRVGGVTAFEVRNAATNQRLAGGVGEAGRSEMALTIVP